MPIFAARVKTGRELDVCSRMQGRLNRSEVAKCRSSKCMVLRSEIQKRFSGGEWRTETVVLFSGYVLVDAKVPEECDRLFRSLPGCYGLLTSGQFYQCLTRDEVVRLSIWTDQEDCLLKMSEGRIDENGGRAFVTKGPLKGHEVTIVRLNRHKRFAFVEVGFLGRTTTVKVGLEILSNASSN